MKRIFRLFPLSVLAALMIVISCQHDDAVRQNEQIETLEPQLSIIMESGEHLRTINPTIYQRLSETSRHAGALDNAENDTAGFTLDLSMVQIIERNTYTQYTTSVFDHAEYQTYLINYLLLHFDDGSQYQFLVKYPRIITDQGTELDRANAVMERIDGDTLLQAENDVHPCLDGVPEILNTYQQYNCEETPCTGREGHNWGENCPCATLSNCTMPTRSCGWQTVNVWTCSGGGTQAPSGDGGTADGGNNNDPNDDPNNDDPIETVPILSDWEQIEDCMNTASFTENIQLTSAMVVWLQTNNSQIA
ncbi:hypothetical protein IMCC3317_05100 [Kordia antarctica]|uniref:Lipoprotein n=1 Tax=Kordia antarctica TaxID=1218801 RepID=A0A7L4ZGY4_9FLAO|nr:hypothetical protein [Kordia antarctica]QHI35164.1 hypothetical protein IMCC3317_05100 [Kordia antarctica]